MNPAALKTNLRDLRKGGILIANMMTLWFFATPIIYPIHLAPADMTWILNLNPMTHVMRSYQQVMFFEGPLGHLALGVIGDEFPDRWHAHLGEFFLRIEADLHEHVQPAIANPVALLRLHA